MPDIPEQREVIASIAGPSIEVTNEWLEEMVQRLETIPASLKGSSLRGKTAIKAVWLDYFEKLGWTDPDSPYSLGYHGVVNAGGYADPSPRLLLERFAGLSAQNIDIKVLTSRNLIALAGQESDRLTERHSYIERLGDLAIRLAKSQGLATSDFSIAEVINKNPKLLHMPKKQLRSLARSLFELDYSVLNSKVVSNNMAGMKVGRLTKPILPPAREKQEDDSRERWQTLRSVPTEQQEKITSWFTIGSNKINKVNRDIVTNARRKFLQTVLLENEDSDKVGIGEKLHAYAKTQNRLPLPSSVVDMLQIIESFAGKLSVNILQAHPDLFYLAPRSTKQKLEAIQNTNVDPIIVLIKSPTLLYFSKRVILQKITSQTVFVAPDKASAAGPDQELTPAASEATPKPSAAPAESVETPVAVETTFERSPLRKIYSFVTGVDSFEDFINICPELVYMSSKQLRIIEAKAQACYEADMPCTVRTVARLARGLERAHP